MGYCLDYVHWYQKTYFLSWARVRNGEEIVKQKVKKYNCACIYRDYLLQVPDV